MFGYYRPKHKVFISYYHAEDQRYKDYIDRNLSNNIINKSVVAGEYDSHNSAEYVKRLIREEKVSDSSVIIVLVGANTKKRKHVDWEIYAGLRRSVNGCSALIGILLPSVIHYGGCFPEDLPQRLNDNVQSKYADLYTWDYAVNNFDYIINKAFNEKNRKIDKVRNNRIQMQYNV